MDRVYCPIFVPMSTFGGGSAGGKYYQLSVEGGGL